ncbi:hypothetical protein [Paramagnetospirillum magneticum]|nr:hypothetical protein [Paramagnetospirillum magneticum]
MGLHPVQETGTHNVGANHGKSMAEIYHYKSLSWRNGAGKFT